MKWIKRDNCNTIAEVVSRNTGLSIQDFLILRRILIFRI